MSFLRKAANNLEANRPALRAGGSSWHYRIYQWWRSHGGYWPEDAPENLCHYMRVVLIWAPWRWFYWVPIVGDAPPLLFTVFGILIFILLASLYLNFAVTALVIVGTVIMLSIVLGLVFISEKIGHALDFIGEWFFYQTYWMTVLRPWTITLVIVLLFVNYFVGWEPIAILTAFIVGAGLLLLLVVGIVLAGIILSEKITDRRLREHYDHIDKGTSTPNLLVSFIKASKNRVLCPIIYLPGMEQSKESPIKYD